MTGPGEPQLTVYRLDHQIAALRDAQRAPTNPWAIELNRVVDDPDWVEPAACPCTFDSVCARCALECRPAEATGDAA